MQKNLIPYLLVTFFLLSVFYSTVSFGQALPSNISTINVNDLSDAQIKELAAQAQSSGFTIEQLMEAAKTKGMSETQISLLRTRLSQLIKSTNSNQTDTTDQRRRNVTSSPVNQASASSLIDNLGPKIFGADLFNNSSSTFEPNLRLATPVNYILGPDDQLNINVYGNSVVNWKLTVSPEGNINIPGAGVLNVAGKNIEQATESIKGKLSSNNYAIGKGTSVQVTLGDIRSISVIINGEVVKPGTYTLPSLASVFNALYASGGPNRNGSFRQIEVIRNNRIIRHLDVYDFLLKGDQKDNITLKDQDIIRVPTYRIRVEMAGEIKRPALYEVLPGESLQDVINFSGGFTDLAYTKRIQVLQVNDQQRSITDVLEDDFKNYTPLRGDKYIVGKILETYTNRVTINGAVLRPGNFELDKGLTLSQLITKASGLRPDAYTARGSITRMEADNTPIIIPFSVKGIIDKTEPDILLQKEDIISISAISDLRDAYTLVINGQVRRPGTFAYADSMTVEDLIIKAGGLTDAAAANRIEVSRRINNSSPTAMDGLISKVFSVTVNTELDLKSSGFVLKPFDIISVYSAPGFETQAIVKVEGEVVYPGYYTIKNKNEKISDLIKQAGGLTQFAYVDGGTLKRQNDAILGYDKNKVDTTTINNERADRLKRISTVKDSGLVEPEQLRNNYVGIDLRKILDKPGSNTDLILQEGDVLRIPKELQTVRVNGEVLYPSAVVYTSGESFKGYVLNAGGFSDYALRRGSYVIYPNGTVKGTSKFLFFNSYPDVKPGSEIYIPKKRANRGLSTQELIGLSSALIGMGAIVLGILSLHK